MRKTLLALATLLVSMATMAQTEWAGTYTIVSNDPFIYTESAEELGYSLSETFTFEIAKQDDGTLALVKFMGFDLAEAGGIQTITIDGEKPEVAYLPITRTLITQKYYEYTETLDEGTETQRDTLIQGYEGLFLLGDGMAADPIKLTKQSDGQLKMSNFVLAYRQKGGSYGPLAWYSKNWPENGGDPEAEVVHYDWAGTYLVTSNGTFLYTEDYEAPAAFLMTIVEDMWNPGTYILTEFFGYDGLDMTNIFTGGIPISFDEEDGDKCYISVAPGQNLLGLCPDQASYYAITDAFGIGEYPIALTHAEDDSFAIDMFGINTYGYAEDFVPESIGFCLGCTAKKGEREALQAELDELLAGVKGIAANGSDKRTDAPTYNLAGQRVSKPARGIFITGGRKVYVK